MEDDAFGWDLELNGKRATSLVLAAGGHPVNWDSAICHLPVQPHKHVFKCLYMPVPFLYFNSFKRNWKKRMLIVFNCSFLKMVDLRNFGRACQFWKNSDWLIELWRCLFGTRKKRRSAYLFFVLFFLREDGSAYLGSIHYGSEDWRALTTK